MNLGRLPLSNLLRNPGRTALLVAFVAVLACALLAGSTVVQSLRNGLSSLEDRLGADVIVAPDSAKSMTDLAAIMLDGVPGYFYMDDSYVAKIAAREGVQKVSPQYYLATVKAGCCTMPVQIIGIDPETDFTIQPWIDHSNKSELGLDEVVVGCKISGAPGAKIMFYGIECTIASKLDETGTALDSAVFCTSDTLKDLIRGSEAQGMDVLSNYDPDHIVSTIQVKVAEGYSATDVMNDIKLHVRGVTAVQARAMTSGVADSIAGASSIVSAMVIAVWVLVAIVLAIMFTLLGRQRGREFAILRVLGATRRSLAGIVLKESLIASAAGAAGGIVVAAGLVYGFKGALEGALGLPFLLPDAAGLGALAALAFVVSLVIGPAAATVSALRLSKVDPGQVLREE